VELAEALRRATDALLVTVESLDDRHWKHVPQPGIWSIGKEIEHLIEAAAYHQWIVRRTIGDAVPSRRPVLERARMTTSLSPHEGAALLRRRMDDGVLLLRGLTVDQLQLATRPPRANGQILGQTIEGILIRHLKVHRQAIRAKLEIDIPPGR
jgi:hypothetical protein